MMDLRNALSEAALVESIDRRKAEVRSDLIAFSCFVDPSQTKWYHAKHLRKIAGVLMKAAETPGARIAITLPPRHFKSSLASEKFPAWYLGHHPERSVILASHSVTLAEKFSRTVRDMIASNERYRALFPKTVLRTDMTRVDDWLLTAGTRSSFRAAGVGGGILGMGGHLLILDDPIMDYEQSQSLSYKKALWEWYRTVFRQRIQENTVIAIIMSRWNNEDIVGKLVEAEKYGGEHFEVIDTPAYDEKTQEYLWPERYRPEEYEAMKTAIGDFAWRAQWLCRPEEDTGSEIQRSWFQFFPSLPEKAQWQVQAWDLALTEKQVDKPNPDWTASVKGTVHENTLWLGEPILVRENWTKVRDRAVQSFLAGPTIRQGTGKAMQETATVQALEREGYSLEQVNERRGDHRTRASVWINWARTGRVKLVGTPDEWDSFLAQWCAFPFGHDDAVDAVSNAAEMLSLQLVPQTREQTRAFDERTVLLDRLGRIR